MMTKHAMPNGHARAQVFPGMEKRLAFHGSGLRLSHRLPGKLATLSSWESNDRVGSPLSRPSFVGSKIPKIPTVGCGKILLSTVHNLVPSCRVYLVSRWSEFASERISRSARRDPILCYAFCFIHSIKRRSKFPRQGFSLDMGSRSCSMGHSP